MILIVSKCSLKSLSISDSLNLIKISLIIGYKIEVNLGSSIVYLSASTAQ